MSLDLATRSLRGAREPAKGWAAGHRAKRHTVRILVMAALLALTAACENRPPPSPAELQLQHRFEVGCRPQDSIGYEEVSPYCGSRGTMSFAARRTWILETT